MGIFFKKIVVLFFFAQITNVFANACDAKINYKSSEYIRLLINKEAFSIYHLASFSDDVFFLENIEAKANFIYKQVELAFNVYDQLFQINGIARGRYANDVKINFLIKKNAKYNGQTFSRTYKFIDDNSCVLLVILNSKNNNFNLTPSHELFHLYHFYFTTVNRAWLNEGLARWAMHIFREDFSCKYNLPLSKQELNKVFMMSYSADKFWSKIICLIRRDSDIYLTGDLNGMKIYGGNFIRSLFNNLRDQERVYDYKFSHDWRKSKKYLDMAIVESLKKSINEYYEKGKELDMFLEVLNSY